MDDSYLIIDSSPRCINFKLYITNNTHFELKIFNYNYYRIKKLRKIVEGNKKEVTLVKHETEDDYSILLLDKFYYCRPSNKFVLINGVVMTEISATTEHIDKISDWLSTIPPEPEPYNGICSLY